MGWKKTEKNKFNSASVFPNSIIASLFTVCMLLYRDNYNCIFLLPASGCLSLLTATQTRGGLQRRSLFMNLPYWTIPTHKDNFSNFPNDAAHLQGPG
jgi:hypothetical protein